MVQIRRTVTNGTGALRRTVLVAGALRREVYPDKEDCNNWYRCPKEGSIPR